MSLAKGAPVAKLSRVAPEIPVLDLRESIDYYERKLGFHVVMEMPSGDYAVVERDDIAIHLFRDPGQEYPPAGIHIFTDQLDNLYLELQQRGAHVSTEILRRPWGNRDFRVRDHSGNEIKFTEPLQEPEVS